MKHEAGIFDACDPQVEAAQIARARADAAAGRVHSHAVVSAWLKTWGDQDFEPFHEWLSKRDG